MWKNCPSMKMQPQLDRRAKSDQIKQNRPSRIWWTKSPRSYTSDEPAPVARILKMGHRKTHFYPSKRCKLLTRYTSSAAQQPVASFGVGRQGRIQDIQSEGRTVPVLRKGRRRSLILGAELIRKALFICRGGVPRRPPPIRPGYAVNLN